MSDKEFVNGLIVKAPHEKAPDFVKCKISIKRQELIDWLNGKSDDWINLDVKVSRGGKWYAEIDDWKPQQEQPKDYPSQGGDFDDDIPFMPVSGKL